MTYHEFRNEVLGMMKLKPKEWRDGQFVFNHIDEYFGVARTVQYIDGIDCFYNDNKIDAFIETCYKRITGKKIITINDITKYIHGLLPNTWELPIYVNGNPVKAINFDYNKKQLNLIT
jgi:hypothetical protein